MTLKSQHPIEEIRARDLSLLHPAELEIFIQKAFQYWRAQGFPYRELSAAEIERKFNALKNNIPTDILKGKRIWSSTSGLDLANYFHPQMWQATRWGHHKSPIDYFNDDQTLRKLLEKTIKLWPERKCWSAHVIRSMFRIYSGGRVSNFRPTASKALIAKYSAPKSTVLDFCAGFGGRLLGAMTLDRHYIGIDPSPNQIEANKRMFNALGHLSQCSAEFHQGCAEEVMPLLPAESADLIFTSPPYFKQEKYNRELNQSYIRYKKYEEWKKDFLEQVIAESSRLLRPDGLLVINIADIRGYPLATDFEKLAIRYFSLLDCYQLDMVARPMHRKNGIAHKTEPVFVFRKNKHLPDFTVPESKLD